MSRSDRPCRDVSAARASAIDGLIAAAVLLSMASLAVMLFARARAAEEFADGPTGYAIACGLHRGTGIAGLRECADLSAAERCLHMSDFPSRPSQQATGMNFVNRSQETLKLFWLDFHGDAQLYHTMGPGGRATQSTFVGHTWLVTTQDGQCIGIYNAAPISIAFF